MIGVGGACRFGTLLLLGLSLLLVAGAARAEERGAIEGDAHASVGRGAESTTLRAGVSAGYRVEPHLAVGGRLDSAFTVADGESASFTQYFARGTFLQAYADGRLFPDSFIDLYSRLSLGAGDAHRNLDAPREGFQLHGIVDVEVGPELRLFFTGKRPHRPTLFARAHVGATLIGTGDSFTNWGFALGYSG